VGRIVFSPRRRGLGPDAVRRTSRVLVALILMVVVPAAAQVPVAPAGALDELEVVDLGVLPGGNTSFADGINDHGHVVGYSYVNTVTAHAFLWRRGRMTDLGTLGGDPLAGSAAHAINDRGQVVGSSDVTVGPGDVRRHAVMWHDGRITDLGTLGGNNSHATDINDRGDIVGYSETAVGDTHAFRWRRGRMVDLGTVAGQTHSEAEAVNDRGEVVGFSGTGVVWRGTAAAPLAVPSGAVDSITADNNDLGDVAGYGRYSPEGDVVRAVVWRDGTPQELGLATTANSFANGINNRGQVVGHDGSVGAAFVWQRGQVTYLPTLVPGFSSASAINDRGQIAGTSAADDPGPSSAFHAVLWR
jgi:probable HAF family extracellular repeat protein